MTRRPTAERPTPTRTLAQDVFDFMVENPNRQWTPTQVAVMTGWPVQSVRVAMNYLHVYREECVRVAPGLYVWEWDEP